MKMQKRKFRIGELAKLLNVESFVVRFWEKEFLLKATRSGGGQRFYDEKDLEKFKHIKELLYEKGYTINGARKLLKTKAVATPTPNIIASQKTTIESHEINRGPDITALENQILHLQKQLLKLRELL